MKIPTWLPQEHWPIRAARSPRVPLVRQWMRPFVRFLETEASGGMVLLGCTALALVLANSPWSEEFAAIWQIKLGFSIGQFELVEPLALWINDGLMAVFFFVVGLEIKREFVHGELRDPRKAALPVAAAIGGMVVPAAIFLALQWGKSGQRGWGVPMATDIAFVVGFLAMLGRRIPFNLKILLLTLAIVDDIGAVLVIAVAYSAHLEAAYLGLAALGCALAYGFNHLGVRTVPVYFVIGAGIWLAFLESGVHPTVAGVLLGLLTPASAWYGESSLLTVAEGVLKQLRKGQAEVNLDHHEEAVDLLVRTARETISPLDRLETSLHTWVAFGIMPLFALANAGVAIRPSALLEPISVAVACGLVLGKPVGILAFSWLAVKTGVARLPHGVDWKVMLGGACLAGIGFTMSLFIAGLALKDEALAAGKIGTLSGSLISSLLGSALLLLLLKPRPQLQGASGA